MSDNSVSNSRNIFAEGVNDNGSGMAALFEITRLIFLARQECPFQNTIILVAFDIEEMVSSIKCIMKLYYRNSIMLTNL